MAKYRVTREPVVQPQDQSIRYIPLTQGQVAIVSAHRYEFLIQWNWYARWSPCTESFYAVRKVDDKSKQILMHNVVLGIDPANGHIGDHRNGNTLDNRDENLRQCTKAQNCQNQKIRCTNTSGCRGVDWSKEHNLWTVRVGVGNTRIFVGRFADKEEAIKARKAAEIRYHGEFVR